MNNFSPNMLKTYQSCPQKYWFKYVQKISIPQKISLFEKGKKVHALANYYLRGDDISKLETALEPSEKELWIRLKNNEYFKKTYVASEYNLSCKVGKYWVGGRLDAVVKDETSDITQYYILDYKTGSIPKNPEYDFQTMVYLLCLNKKLSETSSPNIKFVYIDLKNNKNHVIEFKSESEYSNLITEICQKIEDYQPLEDVEHSKMCEFCEYRKICF